MPNDDIVNYEDYLSQQEEGNKTTEQQKENSK
jgi:hypothetical protein